MRRDVVGILARILPLAAGGSRGAGVRAVLLAVPAAVLLSFSSVLGEVVELPDKLRSSPGLTREHAAQLQAIAQDAKARDRPAWRRLPGSTWRLATLVRPAPALLAPHAPLLPLLTVPFLLATVVAALLVPLVALA